MSERSIEMGAYFGAQDAARSAPGRARASAMATAVHAHADEAWARVRSGLDRPGARWMPATAVACATGCSWCCYQQVAVLPAEVLALARHVAERFTAEERTALLDRLADLDARTRGQSALERARLREPCAFLVAGRCSIYEARPLRCRGVHSRDAGHCQWAMENPDEAATARRLRTGPGPFVVESLGIADAALRGLARACRDAGLDCELLELTAAARMALAEPMLEPTVEPMGEPTADSDAGLDVEERFLAGEPVFAGAALPASSRSQP